MPLAAYRAVLKATKCTWSLSTTTSCAATATGRSPSSAAWYDGRGHSPPTRADLRVEECGVSLRCGYGTTSEFGFDYLRDNMKPRKEMQFSKTREFAIVDEVDTTLIDEARTPLIISGPAHDSQPRYELADRLARHLMQKQGEWAKADDEVRNASSALRVSKGRSRTRSMPRPPRR